MASAIQSGVAAPAIQFENVHLGFGEGEILRGVSFCLENRETLVLLGETGTGKTLTLKLAAGLVRPSSGDVQVLGRDVSRMPERQLLAFRREVGFVFQEGALFDSMTVGDNVAYRLHEDGLPAPRSRRESAKSFASSSSSTRWICFPPSFPAACGGALPSRGPWSIVRILCSMIRPPQVSTLSPAKPSSL